MLKTLVHYGNTRALVIDKAILQAAGLDEDTVLFLITVNPSGGISIQSVEASSVNLHKEAFREVLKENEALMKRLSKR